MMNESQTRMATAAASGLAAIMYVTDPRRWAAFCAFAEQQTPGQQWTEADRQHMREDAKLLWKLQETLEAL